MRRKNRKSIARYLKLPQFTTMNVIDGQAGLVISSSLIFYSLTIYNILNIIVLLILAGVSIITLTGDNGIINRTATAKQTTEEKAELEKVKLAVQAARIHGDSYSSLKAEDVIYALQKDNIAVTGSSFPLTAASGLYQFTIDANGNVGPKEEVKVTLKIGTSNVEIKAENASTYYGSTITNYTPTKGSYQLFYIDFANDFGDGEGTIYLKATCSNDSSQKMSLSLYDTVNKPETLIRKVNIKWAEQPQGGMRSETQWDYHEKASAWLCQPTRSADTGLWKDFYDIERSEEINYVIGSPSVDMYVKSYNSVPAHVNKLDYCFAYYWNSRGYVFKPEYDDYYNGYGCRTRDYAVMRDCNNMYCQSYTGSENWMALCSPNYEGPQRICMIDGDHCELGYNYWYNKLILCPIVSLKTGFVPELEI